MNDLLHIYKFLKGDHMKILNKFKNCCEMLILGKFYITPEPYKSNFTYGNKYQLTKKTPDGKDHYFELKKSLYECAHGKYEIIKITTKEGDEFNYCFSNNGKFCHFTHGNYSTNKNLKCSMCIPDYKYCSLKIASLLLYEFFCYRENYCRDLDPAEIDLVGGDDGTVNEKRKLKLYLKFGYKIDQRPNCKYGKYDSSFKNIIKDSRFEFDIELCKDDMFK